MPLLFATEIIVPSDGYYVKVTVSVCVGILSDTGDEDAVFGIRLKREGNEVARAFLGNHDDDQLVDSSPMGQLIITYVDMAPDPLETYDYDVEVTVECEDACATGAREGYINPGISGTNDTYGGGDYADSDDACSGGVASSWILLEGIRAY